jgi:hypothetical protein
MAKGGTTDFDQEAARVEQEEDDRIRPILSEIARQRKKAQSEGLNFTGLSNQELRRKLSSQHSPIVGSQGWSGTAPPGGTITYGVSVYNPDPVTVTSLYAHVFIGPANVVPDVGHALALVDARFPRLTQPAPFGLSLAPQAWGTLAFKIEIPGVIQLSNYLGNAFLFKVNYADVGTYYDRGCFPFTVT